MRVDTTQTRDRFSLSSNRVELDPLLNESFDRLSPLNINANNLRIVSTYCASCICGSGWVLENWTGWATDAVAEERSWVMIAEENPKQKAF